MRVTINNVNLALAAAGHEEILVRGEGYFYFAEGEAGTWGSTSVYVYHLTDFSVKQWVAERDSLAARKW